MFKLGFRVQGVLFEAFSNFVAVYRGLKGDLRLSTRFMIV